MTRQNAIYHVVQDQLNDHVHCVQQVAPWGAVPILLTSGVGAFTFGAYSADIIAAGITTYLFDLHWVIFTGPTANANYEIEFVYGAADTLACRCQFSRAAPFTASISVPVMTR